MAAATSPFPPLRNHFLKEGLLLPARNPALFGRVMALTVAETALKVYLVMLLRDIDVILVVGAVILLSSVTVGPVVRAITTSAAVATCGGVDNETDDAPTFRQVVAKALYGGDGGGTVATAIHVQILAVACDLGAAALAFPAALLVSYTPTPLLLDVLLIVVLIVSIARLYVDVVLSVALVVSASEPGRHRLTAALRRAWVLTAENADNAVICVLADYVLAAVTSPWRTASTPSGEPLVLVPLLISSAVRLLSVCVVTAFYDECRRRVQEPTAERQLIATGKEWLISLPMLCGNKFPEILQGRCSVPRMLGTLRAHLRYWSIRMIVFVSNHPWVAGVAVVCVGGLITEGPPAIFYQNSLVSYRNFLRRKYHIYPANRCVGRG